MSAQDKQGTRGSQNLPPQSPGSPAVLGQIPPHEVPTPAPLATSPPGPDGWRADRWSAATMNLGLIFTHSVMSVRLFFAQQAQNCSPCPETLPVL